VQPVPRFCYIESSHNENRQLQASLITCVPGAQFVNIVFWMSRRVKAKNTLIMETWFWVFVWFSVVPFGYLFSWLALFVLSFMFNGSVDQSSQYTSLFLPPPLPLVWSLPVLFSVFAVWERALLLYILVLFRTNPYRRKHVDWEVFASASRKRKYFSSFIGSTHLQQFHTELGTRGGVVVEALRYKPASRGFDSRWCHPIFSLT
jgi:hypothetical protein